MHTNAPINTGAREGAFGLGASFDHGMQEGLHDNPGGSHDVTVSDREAKTGRESLVFGDEPHLPHHWDVMQRRPRLVHMGHLGAAMMLDTEDRERPSGGDVRRTSRGDRIYPAAYQQDVVTSDARAKTPPAAAGNPMVHFLDAIHPYSYEYKDGRDDTMGQQGAKRVGIIAQEADADPVGHTMIQHVRAPDGKNRLAINMGAGLSVALASDAALQEEIDALKAHLGIGGARGKR